MTSEPTLCIGGILPERGRQPVKDRRAFHFGPGMTMLCPLANRSRPSAAAESGRALLAGLFSLIRESAGPRRRRFDDPGPGTPPSEGAAGPGPTEPMGANASLSLRSETTDTARGERRGDGAPRAAALFTPIRRAASSVSHALTGEARARQRETFDVKDHVDRRRPRGGNPRRDRRGPSGRGIRL